VLLLGGLRRGIHEADDLIEQLAAGSVGLRLARPVLPVEWTGAPVSPIADSVFDRRCLFVVLLSDFGTPTGYWVDSTTSARLVEIGYHSQP